MDLLLFIALLLFILWALGLFAFPGVVGNLIWILLIIAIIVALYDLFVSRRV